MQKTTFSPWQAVISVLLLAGLITGIWLWPAGAGPSSTTSRQPSPGLPPEEMQMAEPAPTALPAISPALAAAIRQGSNHSTEGLKESVNPDGSITLDHQGRFQSVMVAVKGPDGKIHMGHGEDFLHNIKTE